MLQYVFVSSHPQRKYINSSVFIQAPFSFVPFGTLAFTSCAWLAHCTLLKKILYCPKRACCNCFPKKNWIAQVTYDSVLYVSYGQVDAYVFSFLCMPAICILVHFDSLINLQPCSNLTSKLQLHNFATLEFVLHGTKSKRGTVGNWERTM